MKKCTQRSNCFYVKNKQFFSFAEMLLYSNVLFNNQTLLTHVTVQKFNQIYLDLVLRACEYKNISLEHLFFIHVLSDAYSLEVSEEIYRSSLIYLLIFHLVLVVFCHIYNNCLSFKII